MRIAAILVIALILAGCASSPPAMQHPPEGQSVAALDPRPFLAQSRCADGALELAELDCTGARPQAASDPMLMRRFDWGGYQAGDTFAANDGQSYVTTFSYAPFGPFRLPDDGGEVYAIDGGAVRISLTQDGGKPYLQQFSGAACGGTGWVLFRTDAPTGSWGSVVARLSGDQFGTPCSAAGGALTRYRLEQVAIPFLVGGVRTDITLPTIISEHYDRETLEASRAMERTFLAKGVGRAGWESWGQGPAADPTLPARCPGTAWSVPPAPGWELHDCRYATDLRAADGSMTGDAYGWPPAGSP